MGLDVYLYRYENFEDTMSREAKFDKFSEDMWNEAGDWNLLTNERKNEIKEIISNYARKYKLNEDGEDTINKQEIELDSKLYPDMYFKIGYFRSSYNPGGINNVLRNYNLPDLYVIFENHSEEYIQKPNWHVALDNINDVIDKFSKVKPYRVTEVSQLFLDGQVKSERDAYNVFITELDKSKEYERSFNYSNKFGDFYLEEPIEVVALIPGTKSTFTERPCTYVVTKTDNTNYMKSLEIVRETINYVLAQKDINKYYLKWSG